MCFLKQLSLPEFGNLEDMKKKHPGHKNPNLNGNHIKLLDNHAVYSIIPTMERKHQPKPHHRNFIDQGRTPIFLWHPCRNVIIVATLKYLEYAGQKKKVLLRQGSSLPWSPAWFPPSLLVSLHPAALRAAMPLILFPWLVPPPSPGNRDSSLTQKTTGKSFFGPEIVELQSLPLFSVAWNRPSVCDREGWEKCERFRGNKSSNRFWQS